MISILNIPLKLIQQIRARWIEFSHRQRLARWGWLWPALIIAVLAVLAAQPLMRSSMTCSHDGGLYFLRVVEGDHLVRHGYLYPRWAPDMAYGYGYPLFNFYAPLSWYVAELYSLAGLPLILAWNAALASCLLTSGLLAYLLARDWMTEHGALVAAAAYLLAPYLLYDIYFRGNLAESVALPILPLVLWAFGRLVRSGQARYLALAAISLALLMLAHQIIIVLFGPVLLVYILLLWRRQKHDPWHLLMLLTAGILALGLSAFFWAPAFLEKDTVHIEQSFTPAGMNLEHNFLTLKELFSPPVFTPQDLINPSPPRSLNLAALAMGLLGLSPLAARFGQRFWLYFKAGFPIFARDISSEVRRAWRIFAGETEPPPMVTHLPAYQPPELPIIPPVSSRERRQLLLLAGVLGLGFMTLAPSLLLWEYLPLFNWAQFPWRFLGPASLVLALLAGNGLSLLFAKRRCRWLELPFTIAAITLLLISSLGWLYPRDCGQPDTSIAAVPRFERNTGIIGTTSAGEYLPRYVKEMPDPAPLAAMYEAGEPITRLDPASLPEGATVELAEYELASARLLVNSPEPFRAIYRALYFPGWRVTVNGQNVPIIITSPHGLISFDLPAGQSAIQVWFGTTPLRLGGALLSGATLLMILWLIWQGRRESVFAPASAWIAVPWWQWAMLIALALGLLRIKTTWIDEGETWLRPSLFDGQELQKVDVPLDVNWSDELTLLGYNLPDAHVTAGEAISLELFWTGRDKLSGDYAFSVRLVDAKGLEWSPKGTRRPGGFHGFPKTTSWPAGEYARDVHLIDVLPGTPPGQYELRVTAFERETQTGLDVLNNQGMPVGQSVAVAAITVTAPERPPALESLAADYAIDAPLGDLVLLGLSLGRLQSAPGDTLLLTTFWQAEQISANIHALSVNLVDSLGQTIATLSFLPGAPQYDPSQWQPGEIIRDQQLWVIPPNVPTGQYEITFNAQDREGESHGPIRLKGQKLEIIAPERQMDVPDMPHQVGANLGNMVTLLGYDLTPAAPQPGSTIQLTLYWRAERQMQRNYKVFVHLLDAEGRIRAQHDTLPANWTRPTTGWLAGEIIIDTHKMPLDADAPPGEYTLEVGLYEEQTNTRLPLLDGAERPVDERVILEIVPVQNPE